MSTIDLTTIFSNLSQSLRPVEQLVMGFGYVFGILFIILGLFKLTKINGRSREHLSTPIACIVGGAVLIYLPSSVEVLSNTLFGGSANILQYATFSTYSLYDSIKLLIQTSGIIWFVRGTVLLIHAAEPGKQHGPKGLLFVIAGILSINFEYTLSMINTLANYFFSLTTKLV